jgi:KDO2-lipid IV(A) lauroyltransferase
MIYYFAIVAKFIVLLFPHTIRVKLFQSIAYLIYLFLEKRNRVIEANVKYVYGDIDAKKIKDLKIKCYRYMMLNLLTMLEAKTLDKERMLQKTTIENREYIDELIAQNKPIIIVTAHYGNIEILGYTIGKFITDMVQIQRGLDSSEKLTRLMKTQRQSYGIHIVEKTGAVRHLVKALKNNKVISLVVDQYVSPKKGGVKIKFLGKDAYQTESPAFLARKFNAAILPVFMHYEDDFTYKISFKKPFFVEKTDDETNDILQATQKQADIISQTIFEDPAQWFWCHKRFNKTADWLYEK